MARKKEPQLIDINQTNIITVAKRLFRENGIDNTKVDDVAKEARMSKSTLYVYFKSKEDIKNYIALEAMRYLYEQLKKELSDKKKDFHDKFISICNIFVTFKEKYPLNFQLMVEEISVADDDLQEDKILREIYEIGEELNHHIFLYLKEKLHIDDESQLVSLVFTLWGSIYGICVIADYKEKYILKAMKQSKVEFLNQSFEDLFQLLKERTKL
ncbi:MAG: transcriptional regulator TetR family [Haloplasmataceae bacterium]|nr:transcriptional regulator TetR family [Haloplasmataceae bacterium]